MTDRMESLWQTSAASISPEKASRARKQKRVWRYPYPTASSSSTRWTKPLRRKTRVGRSLLDSVQEGHKQAPFVPPVVVAEHVFVQVRLKVLGRNAPVDAAHAALEVRPEALKRVRVDIAAHVDLQGVGY